MIWGRFTLCVFLEMAVLVKIVETRSYGIEKIIFYYQGCMLIFRSLRDMARKQTDSATGSFNIYIIILVLIYY